MHELGLGSSEYHPVVGFSTYIGETLCSLKANSLSTNRIIIKYSKWPSTMEFVSYLMLGYMPFQFVEKQRI
jgi:hypothetical protein